ncbi:MAG TPA: hypothetical protein ENK60_01755 [Anaerolineae bacterium]|nr:hypothetical protein [Anaerolineae bacterium]
MSVRSPKFEVRGRWLGFSAFQKRNTQYAIRITLLILIPILILIPSIAHAQGGADPNRPTNEQCLVCHEEPGLSMVLPSNEVLPLSIDPGILARSAHGPDASEEVRCVDCHNDLNGYPHPPFPDVDFRTWQLKMSLVCGNCHEDQAVDRQDSVHARLIAAGKFEAASCSDCHGSHDVFWVDAEKHEVDRMDQVDACAQCHRTIADQYKLSVHGQEALKGNPDVPVCSNCHPAHKIQDPRSAEFRLKSPELCAECHADEELMAKYDISTDVFDTYVADFHGTTVQIFESVEPGVYTNKAVCSDCHGAHRILPPTSVNSSVMSANLVKTCQRCHPDANENFTKSWLGHYRPDWEKYPIVTAVQWFYYLVIPITLGFFTIFVGTDIFRTLKNKLARSQKPVDAGDDASEGGEDNA